MDITFNRLAILAFFLAILPTLACASPLTPYERKIVAAVLVLEASSDGIEGMQAVLNVIYNRAGGDLDRIIPVTVKRGQFSSINSVTNKRTPDYGPILHRAYRNGNFNEAMWLVRQMELGKLEDITFGATHFHAAGQPPFWVPSMQYIRTIGSHHFYTERQFAYEARN